MRRHSLDRNRWFTASTVALGAFLAVTLLAAPASASTAPDCAALFPEAQWSTIDSDGITVSVTGLPDGLANRFNGEVGIVEEWLGAEVGPTDMAVCLVGPDSAFDHTRYQEGSQQFHVVSNLEQSFFAMNTDQSILYVAPAVAYGLSQHALYQNNGDQPFPEPIATTISHWYRARMIDRLPYHHRAQRGANLFGMDSIITWTAGEQQIHQVWDPERNVSSIGDFVDYAVAQRGTDILLSTDENVWSAIEAGWRTSLRLELIGTTQPTQGWRTGLIIVISVITIAAVLIGFGLYRRFRRKPQLPSRAPIPGFFADG